MQTTFSGEGDREDIVGLPPDRTPNRIVSACFIHTKPLYYVYEEVESTCLEQTSN